MIIYFYYIFNNKFIISVKNTIFKQLMILYYLYTISIDIDKECP